MYLFTLCLQVDEAWAPVVPVAAVGFGPSVLQPRPRSQHQQQVFDLGALWVMAKYLLSICIYRYTYAETCAETYAYAYIYIYIHTFM